MISIKMSLLFIEILVLFFIYIKLMKIVLRKQQPTQGRSNGRGNLGKNFPFYLKSFFFFQLHVLHFYYGSDR